MTCIIFAPMFPKRYELQAQSVALVSIQARNFFYLNLLTGRMSAEYLHLDSNN